MVYYNEFDSKAAAWLRELISAGHIAEGVVDERSITDISPHDLTGFTQCHFFAGIGGWSYALRLAGWPDDRPVWTGSCPCQPFSPAGKQLGEKDPRHLWPKFYDLISFSAPPVVFGEQVAGKKGVAWLAGIRADMEGVGYEVGAADLCSASAGPEAEGWIVRGDSAAWEPIVNGSPNIRQRLYWMAHAASARSSRAGQGTAAHRIGSHPMPQRRDPLAESSGRCAPRGLADVHGERFAERSELDSQSRGPEQQSPRRYDPVRCGDAFGLGHTSSTRSGRDARAVPCPQGEVECQRLEPRRVADKSLDAGSTLGLGDSDQSRLAQRRSERSDDESECATTKRAGRQPCYWSEFDIVHCTDGKARRIEPGSFPLAAGVSGRVGLLRGYGNAINTELAAEWIEVCTEELNQF